jgi:hypothetical protein
MPDADRLKGYVDAVANIKDTAKWIIAALGAIFTVLLGGIQLNAFGFARPGGPSFWVLVALGISLAAVAAAL